MKKNVCAFSLRLLFVGASLLCSWSASGAAIKLEVNASEAPRKILHARLHLAVAPGPLTLVYPKWIPGEHGPTGPITDLTGLKFHANGAMVPWRRDDVDMFAFHVTVPAGAPSLDVDFDFLLPPSSGDFSSGASATAQLLDLNWNQVLLYPQGAKAADVQFAATLKLPPGWKFGTALPVANQSGDTVEFAPGSLEQLIDSPVILGRFFRSVPLAPELSPPHFLDRFYGGENCPPKVVPYTLDEVIKGLNEIAAYDWRDFFAQRIYRPEPRAPLGGLATAGWRLGYTNQVPERLKLHESAEKVTDVTFSLGLLLKEDGYVIDVVPGSAAERAGVGIAMKLLAVNERHWTPEVLRHAISAAETDKAPIQLLVENEEYFKTCALDYHGGERYPILERVPARPDLLAEILKPRSGSH